MPNGHDTTKKYGTHKYASHGTSDCGYGCGCWAGDTRSGGPTGLDPFGKCPNNPEDGRRLDHRQDYDNVVIQRIAELESRAAVAEAKLKMIKPSKVQLAKEVASTRLELCKAYEVFARIEVELRKIIKPVVQKKTSG